MGSLPNPPRHRRILFVDSSDPFANNVVGLLKATLPNISVTVVRMDDSEVDFHLSSICRVFDAVVVGPGPGHPADPTHVGFINHLWDLDEGHMLPILGICLGFQSLCYSHGAEVVDLHSARFGIVNPVTHRGGDIFAGIEEFDAALYHAVHVKLDSQGQGKGPEEGGGGGDGEEEEATVSWEPTQSCPALVPLAWDFDDAVNGPILMAARHVSKPFWGVQFHPESICTSKAGKELIKNWWRGAESWLAQRGPREATQEEISQVPERLLNPAGPVPKYSITPGADTGLLQELRLVTGTEHEGTALRWERYEAAGISSAELVEALGYSEQEVVFLDSQDEGRFSIIGPVIPGKTLQIQYRSTTKVLEYGVSEDDMSAKQLGSIEEIWPILQETLEVYNPHKLRRGTSSGVDVESDLPAESPFWGGLMGYISYEAGLETLGVELDESCAGSEDPDINFVFIHRSIVIDHVRGHVYAQSLLPSDSQWLVDVGKTIRDNHSTSSTETPNPSKAPESATIKAGNNNIQEALAAASVQVPSEADYRAKARRCHQVVHAGDSYQLYLTDESTITIPIPTTIPSNKTQTSSPSSAWPLYKTLRHRTPAAFGTFLRLSSTIVAGRSPERFLSWDRRGVCQFQPIKGTLRKENNMTSSHALKILEKSKEGSENMMTVDQMRHEMGSVVGVENTAVPRLMEVEEAETVWRLVSVIQGQRSKSSNSGVKEDGGEQHSTAERELSTGLSILKASLPPSSVTGVPKQISCETLRDVERRPRGIYAGVMGYMDVGGGGDFAVMVRVMVRGHGGSRSHTHARPQHDENKRGNSTNTDTDRVRDGDGDRDTHTRGFETWHIGAGNALTIQSTDEDAFVKMEAKASAILNTLLQSGAS
ncbi:ADC synthase [Astrocystis sublimbata]|nr:ADC synthase [Astrocystis sublimbata]